MAINAQGLFNRATAGGRGTFLFGGTFAVTGTGAVTIVGATTVKTAVATVTNSGTVIPLSAASITAYSGNTVSIVCATLNSQTNSVASGALNVDVICFAIGPT